MKTRIIVVLAALGIAAMAAAEEPRTAAPAPALSPSDALTIRTAQLAAERAQAAVMASPQYRAAQDAQQKLQELVRKLSPAGYQLTEDPQTGDLKLIAAGEPPAGAGTAAPKMDQPNLPKPAAKAAGPTAGTTASK